MWLLLGRSLSAAAIAPKSIVPGRGSYRHSDAQDSLGLKCEGDLSKSLEVPYLW